MHPIVYDIVLLAILLLAALRGYRRGFVLTVCGFLAVFVALIGATVLSRTLAPPVSQMVQPVIEQSLSHLVQHTADSATTVVSNEVEAVFAEDLLEQAKEPLSTVSLTLEQILNALRESDFYRSFVSAIEQAVDAGIMDITSNLFHSVTQYITLQITQAVLFILSFAVVLIAWTTLSHVLDLACHLPVLNTLNELGGMLVGLAQGVLLSFILCWLCKDRFVSPEIIQNTYLFQWFASLNPLEYFSAFRSFSVHNYVVN